MKLDDTEGCPGQYVAIRGRVAAICIGCARFGEPGPQIEPAAHQPPGREWQCDERRSAGHVANVLPDDEPAHPVGLGGVGIDSTQRGEA